MRFRRVMIVYRRMRGGGGDVCVDGGVESGEEGEVGGGYMRLLVVGVELYFLFPSS